MKTPHSSGPPPSHLARPGFTIIELLLVIAIILVLSSLALAVMQSAQNDARQAATESRIAAIEQMFRSVMEDYEVRRLPISVAELEIYVDENPLIIPGTPPTRVPRRIQVKNLKRRIVAELIRSEFPGWAFSAGSYINNPELGVFPSDIIPLGSVSPFDTGFRSWLNAQYPNPNPANMVLLSDRLAELTSSEVRYWAQFNGVTDFNLPGEYLYKMLERIDIDGFSGVEAMGDAAIGDSDDDGILEVVDAWGESLQYRTLQIRTDYGSSNVVEDIYVNVGTTDWNVEDPATLLPVGYEVINPAIPHSVSDIRFQIVSITLDAY